MKFEEFINDLISGSVFPGISVLAGSKGKIVFKGNYGYLSLLPEKKLIPENPVYDLASLTKPLVTAFLILYFFELGDLDEDTRAGSFIEGINPDITVSQLLTHTSGLPAWYPLYLSDVDHIKTIRGLGLISKPGRKVTYSCLGYIALSHIIKKVSGMNLNEAAEKIIFKKAGLKDTFFTVPEGVLERTAPTESGNLFEREKVGKDFPGMAENYKWRRELIIGEANDGNAFYLKGKAGNAGLFSTAADIFAISREFFPKTSSILKHDTVKKFWKNYTPFKQSHRSYGFKLNSSFITSGGRSLSKNAIGHNGFTGTSLWMEEEGEKVFILLTNRIHPEVDQNINFNRIRRKLHKLMMADLNSG
ncbi:MAG: serine hydrolase domain-containing protein [Acidobacteriota bacterium]